MLIRQQDGSFKEVSMVLKNYKTRKVSEKDKITNERQAVLKEFVEAVNADRDGIKYKKLPPSAIAVKLSHLNMFDLKYFLASCKEAKSFSSHFWYSLKTGEEKAQKRLGI